MFYGLLAGGSAVTAELLLLWYCNMQCYFSDIKNGAEVSCQFIFDINVVRHLSICAIGKIRYAISKSLMCNLHISDLNRNLTV